MITMLGRANPGSLPCGIPKSTQTTSPACMAGYRVARRVKPTFVLWRNRTGQRDANAALTLGPGESLNLFVKSYAIVFGKRSDGIACG